MALNQGTSTAAPYQPYQNYQQPQPGQLQNQPGVRVVNQQPSTSTRFPISYPRNPVLAISIFKIIIGTLQFVFGIPNIVVVEYFTSYVAFPVWCGIVFVLNGIFGILSTRTKSKCLIGAFFGLSLSSLFFSVVMLAFNSVAWAFFSDNSNFGCYNPDPNSSTCYYYNSYKQDIGTGMTIFLELLIILELGGSIGAVVYSCKAYSKCCNTCDCLDAGTFVGCCECDTAPTNYQRYQNEVAETSNAQSVMIRPAQQVQTASPCSAMTNLIINFPGACRAFNVAKIPHIDAGTHSIQVTFTDDGSAQTTSAANEQRSLIPQNIMDLEPGTSAGASSPVQQPQQLPAEKQNPPPYNPGNW